MIGNRLFRLNIATDAVRDCGIPYDELRKQVSIDVVVKRACDGVMHWFIFPGSPFLSVCSPRSGIESNDAVRVARGKDLVAVKMMSSLDGRPGRLHTLSLPCMQAIRRDSPEQGLRIDRRKDPHFIGIVSHHSLARLIFIFFSLETSQVGSRQGIHRPRRNDYLGHSLR